MKNGNARQINLASRPFRAERAQTALLAGVCAVLLISLLTLTGLILRARSEAVGLRLRLDAENTALKKLQREQSRFSAVLNKPQNADVFATSVFLNEVIARRGLSWTRVFKDLEIVIPANMRLLGLRLPQTAADEGTGTNRVQLDMNVGTMDPATIAKLLDRLNESKLFGAAVVVNQTPPTQNDPLYKFRVTVAYAQKL